MKRDPKDLTKTIRRRAFGLLECMRCGSFVRKLHQVWSWSAVCRECYDAEQKERGAGDDQT
jgi:hypothetical protein